MASDNFYFICNDQHLCISLYYRSLPGKHPRRFDMKKDIKLMISIIKAAPQMKQKIIGSVLLLFIGILSEILTVSFNNSGGLLLIDAAITYYQCSMLVCGANLVQSSATAKKLQTAYPFFIQIPAYFIIFLIMSIYRAYLANKPLDNIPLSQHYAIQCEHILLISLLFFATMIVEIIIHKFFVLGIIALLCTALPLILYANSNALLSNYFYNITLTNAIIAGIFIIIAGSLLSVLVANLLYKYPISAHVMKMNNKV